MKDHRMWKIKFEVTFSTLHSEKEFKVTFQQDKILETSNTKFKTKFNTKRKNLKIWRAKQKQKQIVIA